MAERIIVQLQHANSAVVLTTIKVLLYLMNYMENRRLIDYCCKKMGPPLGELFFLYLLSDSNKHSSHSLVIGTGSSICRVEKYPSDHPETAGCPKE